MTGEKILSLIRENDIRRSRDDLDIGKSFVEMGFDSVSYMKMIVAIESEFDIEIDDEALEVSNFQTLQDLMKYLETKIDVSAG